MSNSKSSKSSKSATKKKSAAKKSVAKKTASTSKASSSAKKAKAKKSTSPKVSAKSSSTSSVKSSVKNSSTAKKGSAASSKAKAKIVSGRVSVTGTTALKGAQRNGSSSNGKVESTKIPTKVVNQISFELNDMVVYPGHGVGRVHAIQTKLVAGTEHKIFEIVIEESGMKILVPVVQATANGLRKVVDKRAVDKVYTILRDRDFTVDTQTWNRRHREYLQKLNTGSVFEIAEVFRDLSVLGADKELSYGEKQMLESAQALLVSEIAIAKARTPERVIGEIQALFA